MPDPPAAAAAPLVHLAPRERGALDGTMPFRKFYIAFRTVTLILEIATFTYLVWLSVSFGNRSGHYACAIVATVLALLLDPLAVGVLVSKPDLSGLSGTYFMCCDVVVLIAGIIGYLLIVFADFNMEYSAPEGPWSHHEVIASFMAMGVWIAHLLLSIASCVGSCVACGRARRAKRRTERIVYLLPVIGPPATDR